MSENGAGSAENERAIDRRRATHVGCPKIVILLRENTHPTRNHDRGGGPSRNERRVTACFLFSVWGGPGPQTQGEGAHFPRDRKRSAQAWHVHIACSAAADDRQRACNGLFNVGSVVFIHGMVNM